MVIFIVFNLYFKKCKGTRTPSLVVFLHHLYMFAVPQVQEPKVMGQFLAGLQINRGDQREVLLSQVNIHKQ